MAAEPITHETFEQTSWHDDTLHGLSVFTGDIDRDDWRSELILDIDHIVEWVKSNDGDIAFDVAPATLTFHGVTDLAIALKWPVTNFQTSNMHAHIDRIERSRIADQKVHLDRPYCGWEIVFNTPRDGVSSFGAWGYTLEFRSEPIRQSGQVLISADRPPMTAVN